MAAGYIYILVNSSMPDLVKVGKTTRLPSERSSELSGVTGVATPFIVAFEQFFGDCDAAEDFIHAELERRELRQSDIREFFRASPTEVVKIVLGCPGITDPSGGGETGDTNSDADTDLLSPEIASDDLTLKGLRPQRPWDAIYEMAESLYYGEGDNIQDYDEALKLYRDAARLGSSLAHEKIGDMFTFGKGVKEDHGKALRYYKEGAKKGNYFCWAAMASLFNLDRQMDNCVKCFVRYFRERSQNFAEEVEEYPNKHVSRVYRYITVFLDHDLQPDFEAYVGVDADAVEKYAHEVHADLVVDDWYKASALRALNWVIEHRRPKSLESDMPRPSTDAPTRLTTERLAPTVSRPKSWGRR